MSVASSSYDDEAVGTTKIRRVIPRTEKDDFYRCTWAVKGDFFANLEEEFKSPIFTVPNRDECKWYLSVHPLDEGIDHKGCLFFSTRLHLDRTSECKAVVAKFSLEADDSDITMRQSCKSRTFRFDKEYENNAAVLSIVSAREVRQCYDSDDEDEKQTVCKTNVLCTIMIIKVIPEDDSYQNNFGSLLKDKRFTDVALLVGRKKFQAHKAILSARSSVFAAMFAHNTTENQGVVNIKDIRKVVVEEMLHYIYTGEAEKLNDLAQDLLIAADKYDLKGLKSKCEGVLIESLSSSNAIDLLLFAESYEAKKLKFEAIYLIRRMKTELMKTQGWESLSKSNPALVREISEVQPKPESNSDSESGSDASYHDMFDSDQESE